MVPAHLTVKRVSAGLYRTEGIYLPVHETVRSSHWDGVPTVTLNARTAEREEAMHVKERRSDNVRMIKNMKMMIKRDAEKSRSTNTLSLQERRGMLRILMATSCLHQFLCQPVITKVHNVAR